MDEEARIAEIKKYFIQLKSCHDWCLKHFPEEIGAGERKKTVSTLFEGDTELEKDLNTLNNTLLPAVEKIYTELEKRGVDRDFSTKLFIFGARLIPSLWNQFNERNRIAAAK